MVKSTHAQTVITRPLTEGCGLEARLVQATPRLPEHKARCFRRKRLKQSIGELFYDNKQHKPTDRQICMLNPWMCNAFHSHANGPGFVSTSPEMIRD